MILDPENLSGTSAYDLLRAASEGKLGIDRRWLHALIDHPEKTLPDIVRFAGEDHTEDRIPLEQDLISIFQYLKTPLGIPFFIELIRADPSEIPDEAVEALVQIGQPAIEPLLRLYEDVGPEEGTEIAFLLAGMGIHDERILRLLLDRLDVDWDDALFHLEVYHDAAAIPELEKRMATTEGEARVDLADTIGDLNEPRPESHIADFDIWDLYPDEAPPEFDVLSEDERLEFFASPSAALRAQAVTSLFGVEYSTNARAKLLEVAKNDPEPEVRACAWESFFDMTEDPELRRLMMDRMADPSTPKAERAGLALGLARHTDQPQVRATILTLAEDPETRERAVEAMWRSFDENFGADAARHIDDPDIEVRRNAIWGIGYLQVTSHAARLLKFFDVEELRPDALHNYALVAPGPTTRKRVKELYDKIAALANGLSEGEGDAVRAGIDVRLVRAGLKPVFQRDDDDEPEPAPAVSQKIGRNDPCPCGSGKKYKKCCGAATQLP